MGMRRTACIGREDWSRGQKPGRQGSLKTAGKWLRAPANKNDEGLADAGAANPLSLSSAHGMVKRLSCPGLTLYEPLPVVGAASVFGERRFRRFSSQDQ